MTPPNPKPTPPHDRWFSRSLFGLCGEGGACPPAATAPAAPQPATPRWRGAPLAPKKAA
ncbi:MAG TPA: hypothetical protein VGB79_08005 [Allosphingosinicella sp.]|jgi:hypothetical protein